ncbi:MAG: signal peptidase I [Oscillospiraceae bacterium]|nr:signal peptidase I [Oscillospiraceae bacterium]
MILAVILTCLPLTLPRLFGYEIYNVVSGSMEPTIPVGSVIYVGQISPENVREEDVIAFQKDGELVVHRVVKNKTVEGKFVTKGDANNVEDLEPIPYDALVGKVERHFPVAGRFMMLYTSGIGKLYVLGFALCGVMFNVLAGLIRDRQATKRKQQRIAELRAQLEQNNREGNSEN